MTINFIYLVGDKTPEFSIMHYIVLKSWLSAPRVEVKFWTNKAPEYSSWWIRLLLENHSNFSVMDLDRFIRSRLEFEEQNLYKSITNITHKTDYLRLQIIYEEGGIYSDLDYILLDDKLLEFFSGDKPVHPIEAENAHGFLYVPNGLFYAPKHSDWTKDRLALYNNYNPDNWNDTSIKKPTELYKKDPSRIRLISAGIMDPVTWRYEDWTELFFCNNTMIFSDSFALHFSESVTKDFVKYINLRHIMTTDTNFTKLVRRFVSEYWDNAHNTSLISKYE